MPPALDIAVITIFPGVMETILGESILKRAADAGRVAYRVVNPRDFTTDRHRTVDDRPYGGGPGMVMMPGPIFDAVDAVRTDDSRVILMTPQGRRFDQAKAIELAAEKSLVLICGAYEGIDERVRAALVDEEISIGDYVLTNGNLAAATVIDATVRLIPGVLGCDQSAEQESFSGGLLEHPQYTRPEVFRGMEVPPVLRSGNHEQIALWRRQQAEERTRRNRPDLWAGAPSPETDDI